MLTHRQPASLLLLYCTVAQGLSLRFKFTSPLAAFTATTRACALRPHHADRLDGFLAQI